MFKLNIGTISVLLCVLLAHCVAQLTEETVELLNWCIDGKHHKKAPGPEGHLFEQCTPWKNRSCCTYNTTQNVHQTKMYGFNYDHCSAMKNMSEKCKVHFRQDLCFYECSPNIGPWIVKVDMKIRKERYFEVPLCKSDCQVWYDSCKEDYTCTDNWARNFIWDKGENKCFPEAKCRTFEQVFKTAQNFCQKVWDDSWKVVDDSEPCMRLWFDSAYNPNDNVARAKVNHLIAENEASSASRVTVLFSVLFHNALFLVYYLHTSFIH